MSKWLVVGMKGYLFMVLILESGNWDIKKTQVIEFTKFPLA